MEWGEAHAPACSKMGSGRRVGDMPHTCLPSMRCAALIISTRPPQR